MNFYEVNVELFRMTNNLGNHFTYLNPAMTFTAEYMVFFLALSIILFWFMRSETNRMMIVCGAITLAVAEVLGMLAGKVHSNHQPFAELANVNKLIGHAVDNSFPSDHTILFFSFCMTFYLFKKRGRILWLLLAVLVGFSRIWAGVHYPADVFAGAAISVFTAVLVYWGVPKLSFIKRLLVMYERGERRILPVKSNSRNY
ncbi:bacitracin ABC transporter permease [Bacillus sp. FJAT-27231]|uniref:undecaprenyl-diphosphatase n=1 Tax=Bacillus sp. FJAT-27231 TaxID=1679168 RepID=UPI0006716E6D|nr:undecaprenyl-diphosphatase [Bacillus sp. FJAT-27231]KMY55831.1 bacitracin ABC transporter permease [Bacillus sp. FJAT-27231]